MVPLGREACRWVKEYLERVRPACARRRSCSVLFVTASGRALDFSDMNNMVKACTRKAGVSKHVTVHTCRHACATHLLHGGADIRHLQRLLGHESLLSTQIYTQVEIEDLKRIHRRTHPRSGGVDQLRGHGEAGSIESGPRTGTRSRSRAAPPLPGPMRAWRSLLPLLLVGVALLVGLADPARALPIREPIQWRDTHADGRSGAQASLCQPMRNRWYLPGMARFTRRDPIGFAGGVNLYGYVAISPVRARDPLGLQHRQPTPSDVWNSTIEAPRRARDAARQVLNAPVRDAYKVNGEEDQKVPKESRSPGHGCK
ncbi:MAG: tyrosine-type recombinase/integrase [Candidatus Riflebacteria bacterium]|nr:tyrosine-type recombinase/integrase [Candidatus Riflebacteria bacterium]